MRDEGEDLRRVGRDEMNLCEFPIATLSDRVPEGCKTLVFALKSAVSKQLYRSLDKRFYHRRDWTFDPPELAFEHVGLSRNYAVRNIKQKLQPALEELEAIGFLEPIRSDWCDSTAGADQEAGHFDVRGRAL